MGSNRHESSVKAFFALVKSGLWEDRDEFQVSEFRFQDSLDWDEVYQLAEEQSVIGIVLAGIEHFNIKPPQGVLLQWIGEVQILEQRNMAMNKFIAELVERLRKADIYTLLLKGQGIAQCYEKPLWRCCGDVDLFLSNDSYNRAKELLAPIASEVEKEYVIERHQGMTIDGFVVELHGTLRCGLSSRIDNGLEEIRKAIFYEGRVRSWMNGRTQVFLPNVDEDAVYVFTHMLQHFFKEGLGLRQICDWCRLLYTYRDSLNYGLLEQRIKRAGLMSEWKAFGALAIEYLGFPKDSMPLLDVRSKKEDVRWRKKADRIMEFILKSGNMGHNRDMSHFSKYPYLIRKCVSMGRRIGDLINHARIFPLDSLRFFPRIMFNGLRSAMKGE